MRGSKRQRKKNARGTRRQRRKLRKTLQRTWPLFSWGTVRRFSPVCIEFSLAPSLDLGFGSMPYIIRAQDPGEETP